jgi:guanylate kinase
MPSLFILSGPSAVGKDAIIDKLMDEDELVLRGRKITTRKPRPGERKTSSYLFLTVNQFHKRLSGGNLFFDYAKNDILYAIDKDFIIDEINSGFDVFLVFSNYGVVENFKREMIKEGVNTKSVLLLSSLNDLELRIKVRYPHSQEEIPKRLETMRTDLRELASYAVESIYDHVILNSNSEANIVPTVERIKQILSTERANFISKRQEFNKLFGSYRGEDVD